MNRGNAFALARSLFLSKIASVSRNTLLRSIVIVMSGTAGAQVITVIFAPLIARLYGPEAFGVFGLFTAVVALLGPVSALAYPIAIVLAKNADEAFGLVKLSLLVACAVCLVLCGVLIVGGDSLRVLTGARELDWAILLVPPFLFFAACLDVATQWLIRERNYRLLARSAVANSFIVNFSKVAASPFSGAGLTLIVIATISNVTHLMILSRGARAPCALFWKILSVPRDQCQRLAKAYKNFPLYRAPQNLVNAGAQALPVIFLGAMFGPASAGFYALARSVMGLPTNLISKSVSDVIYPVMSKDAHDGLSPKKLMLKATAILAVVGVLPFGLVALWAPSLFEIVFGAEWSRAGEYAQWMSLFLFFKFINRPCVSAIPVLGLERGLLLYELISAAAKVAAIIVGYALFEGDVETVASFAIVSIFSYVVLMTWVYSESLRVRLRTDWDPSTKEKQ